MTNPLAYIDCPASLTRLDPIPDFLGDKTQFWNLIENPFRVGPEFGPSPAGVGILDPAGAVPDYPADVGLIVQDSNAPSCVARDGRWVPATSTALCKEADDDGNKPIQFGLIAEEVAEAFPELVIYDADGKPETVRYDLVSTLLLNEFQKAQGVIEGHAARIDVLEAQSAELAQLKKQVAMMTEVIERLDHDRMVATSR